MSTRSRMVRPAGQPARISSAVNGVGARPGARTCGSLGLVCHRVCLASPYRYSSSRSVPSDHQPACDQGLTGLCPKMTTQLMDNTVPIVAGTTHVARVLTDRDGQLSASGGHQAGVGPRHAVGVGGDDVRRSLAKEQRRKPDSDRDQADDCQGMEDTERVLPMKRQCRHVHENQRQDVAGSEGSVDVCAFGDSSTAAPQPGG